MTVLARAMATIFIFALIVAGAQLAAGGSLAGSGKPSSSVALIMIEEGGCPYCARWHEEVGTAYPKSDEGRFAPLTTYYDHEREADRFKNVVYSPTFIVVKDGREIGRIIGYPGVDFFWPMLDEILVKAGFAPRKTGS